MSTYPCVQVVIFSSPVLESVGEAIHFDVLVGTHRQHATDQVSIRQHKSKIVDAGAHVSRLVSARVQVAAVQRQQIHVMHDEARELVRYGAPGPNVVQYALIPRLFVALFNHIYSGNENHVDT